MPDWVELDSSFIAAAAYDAESEVIYLRYKDDAEWAYEYCPAEEWEQLNEPDQSAGQFFHTVLKSKPQHQIN